MTLYSKILQNNGQLVKTNYLSEIHSNNMNVILQTDIPQYKVSEQEYKYSKLLLMSGY